MQKEIIKEDNRQIIDDFLFSEVWNPAIDVYENEKEIVIFLELAGVRLQDIKLSINKNNVLHIWGERKNPFKDQWRSCYETGLNFGTFSKYFHLPIKIKKKTAELRNINGIFEIKLTKIENNR